MKIFIVALVFGVVVVICQINASPMELRISEADNSVVDKTRDVAAEEPMRTSETFGFGYYPNLYSNYDVLEPSVAGYGVRSNHYKYGSRWGYGAYHGFGSNYGGWGGYRRVGVPIYAPF